LVRANDGTLWSDWSQSFTVNGIGQATTIPTVTQVIASPSSGIENPGTPITLTLDLSKAVTVTGTPTLTLNDGGTATYASGSGTNVLTFSYTVAASDRSVSTLAITQANLPAGATITDAAGNAADLSGAVTTFPGLGIDPPPILTSIAESPSTGDLNVGSTVTLTLNLNDTVTVAGGTPTLTLNDGGTATYTGGTGTNALTFSYTVAGGQNTPSLAVTAVNLNGATVQDSFGNSAGLSLTGLTQTGPQINGTLLKFVGTGDFSAGGLADIAWQIGGGAVLWVSNGSVLTQATVPLAKMGAEWTAYGVGDFNSDGNADLLWINTSGQTAIWEMNGANLVGFGFNPGKMGGEWHVAGIGDFNGDGKSDILWTNTSGQAAVWTMNGTTLAGCSISNGRMGSEWHVAAVGDFNHDGRSDVLWQSTSGDVDLWEMNGANLSGFVPNVGNMSAGWTIAGVGHFSGAADSTSDIVWVNGSNQVQIWQMNNGKLVDVITPNGMYGTEWHLQGVGNFAGDANSDLLWLNNSGAAYVWKINGTQVTQVAMSAPTGSALQLTNNSVSSTTANSSLLSSGAAAPVDGNLNIANSAKLELEGTSNANVTFTGTTGTLKLDESLAFTGDVSGLTAADALDMADIRFGVNTKATFSGNINGGTLAVTDGSNTAHIALLGDYTNSGWTLSSDGGTLVVDPPLGASPSGGSGDLSSVDQRVALFNQYIASTLTDQGSGAAGPPMSSDPASGQDLALTKSPVQPEQHA
jgi:hypothetical protein